jgi:hypothetical protein
VTRGPKRAHDEFCLRRLEVRCTTPEDASLSCKALRQSLQFPKDGSHRALGSEAASSIVSQPQACRSFYWHRQAAKSVSLASWIGIQLAIGRPLRKPLPLQPSFLAA